MIWNRSWDGGFAIGWDGRCSHPGTNQAAADCINLLEEKLMNNHSEKFLNAAGLSAVCAALVCAPAAAQDAAANYPSKAVTFISPFVPGGTTDKGARLYGHKLSESLGKPFVVDFKPGAGATVGANYVAKAAPDGHTLLITSAAYTITAATYKNLPYDPIKDLAPVSLTLKRPSLLMVHPSVPVTNYAEYIAYAKANPGKLNFGTTGMGGSYHIAGAWLHGATDTKVTFVHYKGAALLFTDQVAGRVHVSPASIFNALPFIKSGKTRAIFMISGERSALMPDLKTVAEQGIPGFDYSAWEGIFTAAAVSPAIVNKLAAEFGKIAKMPDVINMFKNDGTIMVGSSAPEFRKHVITEITRWKKVVQDHDIKTAEE